MHSLEYVASGCNYTRLPTPGATELPDNLRLIRGAFDSLNAVDGNRKHSFSIMYNAYCEKHFGKAFREFYKPHVKAIHADSGGLQMVTLGVQNTPELRKQVYENQGAWSDIAMSFDEIPISMVGSRSGRLEMGNRFFDEARFEECAINTGKNLAEQLQHFETTRKDREPARPFFVAQGNCLESYQQWTEIALKQVPKSLRHNIGGVAMGGAALGVGQLEDVKKAFYFTQLPIDCKHIHLLGVGSVSRMLPALVFCQTGVYEKDVHISYDSSTHSSGGEMGRYYLGEKTMVFSRTLDQRFELMYNDILVNFPGLFDVPLKDFHFAMTCGGYNKAKEKFGTTKEAVQAFVILFASSVYNFIRHVNAVYASKDKLLKQLKGVEASAFKNLYAVKTVEDFKHWENHVGKYLPSQSVKIKQSQTIDDLFV